MRLIRFLKKDLAADARGWVADKLVSHEQAEAILTRYGTSLDDEGSSSIGYYVLIGLATLFAGGALLLILSHNWDEIPRAVRMLSLIGLTVFLNAIGIWQFSKGRIQVGQIWLFGGALAYGASIMLIAQIYHLGEHFPDGVLFWAAGVAPMAILAGGRLLAWMLFVLSAIWMWVEIEAGFMAFAYPAFGIIVLWLTLQRVQAMWLFMLTIISLVWWANLLLAFYFRDSWWDWIIADQIPLSVAMGLTLTGLAWALIRRGGKMYDYGLILHIWLLRGAAVLLFVFSFSEAWSELLDETMHLPWFWFLPIGAAIGLYLAKDAGYKAWLPLLVYSVFFGVAFSLAPNASDSIALSLTVASNLLLLFMGIWLIYRGVDESITHYFYFGVTILLVTALLRYFDLIGDYIGGAIAFLIAAGILFAAARFWRHRQLQRSAA